MAIAAPRMPHYTLAPMKKARSLPPLLAALGVDQPAVGPRQALASGLGGCVAIAAVVSVSEHFVGVQGAGLLVASMGASAVLLFALPHGPLSQPWAVVGGHACSAIVGVLCWLLISHQLLAAAIAVGASIGLMQLLRCVHPPGGATALSAVVGGPAVHALGLRYVFTPVLLNAAVIVLVAVAFNSLLARRTYPAYFAKKSPVPERQDARIEPLVEEAA